MWGFCSVVGNSIFDFPPQVEKSVELLSPKEVVWTPQNCQKHDGSLHTVVWCVCGSMGSLLILISVKRRPQATTNTSDQSLSPHTPSSTGNHLSQQSINQSIKLYLHSPQSLCPYVLMSLCPYVLMSSCGAVETVRLTSQSQSELIISTCTSRFPHCSSSDTSVCWDAGLDSRHNFHLPWQWLVHGVTTNTCPALKSALLSDKSFKDFSLEIIHLP